MLTMKKLMIICLLAETLFLGISCSKSDAKGFASTTGKGGSLARFTIIGDYLYTVDKTNLKVFNIASGNKPVLKNTTEVGFEIETIFPFRDKLFIGSTSVVHIFSLEDPERPQKLSVAISPEVLRRCDPVVAKDSVAYATLRTNSSCGGTQSILAVYNIKDLANPLQVFSVPVREPFGLGYSDNALYVCDQTSIRVFDISDGFYPIQKTEVAGDKLFFDVIAYDNSLVCWTESGVSIYDINNKFDPKLIGKIN